MSRGKSFIGEVFGRWEVISEAEPLKFQGTKRIYTYRNLLCKCECGNERIVKLDNLRSGISQSCGCRQKEIVTVLIKELHKSQKREGNPNWRGGSTRKRCGTRFWRIQVIERDNGECRKCGTDILLQAHHIFNYINFPELRGDIDNGITLCKYCHSIFHQTYGYRDNNLEQITEYIA